jgi:hypothetical protein
VTHTPFDIDELIANLERAAHDAPRAADDDAVIDGSALE